MTRTLHRFAAPAVLALVASLALACEPAPLTPAPTAHCRESGAQCQLPDGPLGVCERATCEAGATPPCFRCISQH